MSNLKLSSWPRDTFHVSRCLLIGLHGRSPWCSARFGQFEFQHCTFGVVSSNKGLQRVVSELMIFLVNQGPGLVESDQLKALKQPISSVLACCLSQPNIPCYLHIVRQCIIENLDIVHLIQSLGKLLFVFLEIFYIRQSLGLEMIEMSVALIFTQNKY